MRSKQNRFTRESFAIFVEDPSIQTTYNRLGTLKFSLKGGQFVVVTSSKHEKRAVVRNKLRRRIYNFSNNINTPFSGVFYASKHSYTLPFDEARALFIKLISHATNHTS